MAITTNVERNRALNTFPGVQRRALLTMFGDPLEGNGLPNGATVSAFESRQGAVRQTLLRLNALPQTVVNGTEHQGTKIYDFPEGQILIMGCVASIAQTTTSDITATLNSGVTGALAFGSAASASTTLNGTAANIAPSTAFATSTTINVAGTAVTPFLAAPILLNGTVTPVDLYINTAYATTGDVDADATQTLTGTVIVTWMNLADQ